MINDQLCVDDYLHCLPEACESLNDVREGIDCLDEMIIQLLGKRMDYVLAASRFKQSESDIPAPDRVALMLPQRRRWARDAGLDESYIESLYEGIINWYIAQQVSFWRLNNKDVRGV